MRRTLFWTGLYSSIAILGITIYNLVFLHSADIAQDSQDRFFALAANQQVAHILLIFIVVFSLVRFYYQKHPSENPSLLRHVTTKHDIKRENNDIPDAYFEKPTDKSVADRQRDIVNQSNEVDKI